MSRRLRLLVAGAVVALAASLGGGVTAAPAHAALCSPGAGVSVVVDHGVLGGGVSTVCDADGGGTAAAVFPDNGFDLAYVQRMPGFVCRVNGLPTPEATPCMNTPPPDAYWALFHSDGTSGTWVYAASGVAGLKVSDGESVALVWQSSSTRRAPGVTPPKASSQPQPTATASTRPSPTTSARPSTRPSPTTSGPATPSASPQATASATTSASPTDGATEKERKRRVDRSASPTPEATGDADDVAAPPVVPAQPAAGGGVPLWLVGVLTGLAVVGAGTATYLRRTH